MVKNLKLLRTEHGVSQQKLGDAVGVSQQSINKYENHNIEPDINTLILLADFFNTSVDYLIGYSAVDCPAASKTEGFGKREIKFLGKYKKLDSKQQAVLDSLIDSYLED